jgi:iron complex outermembrane recepter protein
MLKPFAVAGATLLLAAIPALAQVRDTTRADTIFRIGEIRVQAARPVTTVGGSSALEIRLDSMRLPPAPSLEQVLRELPSMHVRTNSRGEAEISVRGSESRQVAVLVDGVPLTLGWDARTDISVVPATAPQEISVVRGLSSILYGPNVLGGIVEMRVGQGATFPQTSSMDVSASVDDVGGFGTSATAAIPIRTGAGQWLVRAGAGLRDSPGAPLADGIAEPVPLERDLRLNTDSRNVDGFLAMRYRGDGGTWFSFSGSGFQAERGIAAELGVEQPRLWRYPHIGRLIAVASGGTGDRDTPLGRGDLEASIGVDVGRSEIRSFSSRAYDEVIGSEDGDARTLTLRLLGDHTLGARGELRSAFTLADITHDATVDGSAARYRQRLWSMGGETVWRVVEDGAGALNAVRFSVGGAVDGGDTPESGELPPLGALTDWGARIGATATLAGGSTLLHAGASRRGRFPALRELYSEAINRFLPNPDLVPEHLVAFEAGVTTRAGTGELQVVGFHHRLSDAIRRITLPDGMRQRVNADQIRSTGLELMLSQSFGTLSLAGDLTLQSVELIDPGTAVSTRPEHVPGVSGGIRAAVPVWADIRMHAEARHTGSQYCQSPDTGVDTRLDAGTALNADASREWSIRPGSAGLFSRLETRVSVDNIGDTAFYDQCGLPRAGRLLRFQVRLF